MTSKLTPVKDTVLRLNRRRFLRKASSQVVQLYRPVSSRGNINIQSVNATSGSALTYKSRTCWPLSAQGGGITKIKAVFLNWKGVIGNTPFAVVGANAWQADKLTLEWNGIGSAATALKKNGSRSFSIPASLQPFETDVLDVQTAFGVAALTSAAPLFARMLGTHTAGLTVPGFPIHTEDQGFRYNKDSGGTNVNLSDDVDSTGSMATPSGASTGILIHPTFFVGYYANGDSVPFWSFGDSKAQGSNDNPSALTGYGYLRRMAVLAGVAHFGFNIFGRNSGDWIGQDHTAEAAVMQAYLSGGVPVQGCGFNKLSPSNTPITDNVTIRGDIVTISKPKENPWQVTHGPKVSSSASKFTDTANQTITNGAFNSGQECDQTNASYIANVGVAGQYITGIIDESTPLRDGTDPTKFKVRGSSPISTGGYTAASLSLVCDTAFSVGAYVCPRNGSTPDPAGGRRVTGRTGSGPYTHTLAAAFTNSYVAGIVVYEVSTLDGTHEVDLSHADNAAANSGFYSTLVSKGVY